jgi:hypothetical protein
MGEGTFKAVHILRYKIAVQLPNCFCSTIAGMEHAARSQETNVHDSLLLHLNDSTACSAGNAISI